MEEVNGALPHKRELLVGEIGVLERERERVGFLNFTVAEKLRLHFVCSVKEK
jgi:hypothetical protein